MTVYQANWRPVQTGESTRVATPAVLIGPPGPQGEQGPQGDQGDNGTARYAIGGVLRTDDGSQVGEVLLPVEPWLVGAVAIDSFYGNIRIGSAGGRCDVTFKVGETARYGPVTLGHGAPDFDGGLNVPLAAGDTVDVLVNNISGDVQMVEFKLEGDV